MLIQTHARGVRGHGPPRGIDKKGSTWCIQSVPKCVIINRILNDIKDNESTTTKIIRHIFLEYQSDVYVSTNINTFIFCKVGLVGATAL